MKFQCELDYDGLHENIEELIKKSTKYKDEVEEERSGAGAKTIGEYSIC